MNQLSPPPNARSHSGDGAVLRRAARLAERLLCRARLARHCRRHALSPEQGAAVMPGAAGDGDDGEAPWHDQTMPMAERMKLAEGRPLRRRMMAAMAQQDCGQCGYNCHDYSEVIAGKSEARLNLCVPGGKETARMLKSLHEELERAPARGACCCAPATATGSGAGRRHRAARATILPRRRSCRASGSTSRARRKTPGISNSISPSPSSTMSSATRSACFR